MRKSEVSIGKRYGRLVIQEDLGCTEGKHLVRCLCDCGKEKLANLKLLKNGALTSCGCFRLERLRDSYEKKAEVTNPKEGDVFGDLTVLKFLEKRGHGNYYYLCRCSCGKTVEVQKHGLLKGSWKSCGCKRTVEGHKVHSERSRQKRVYSEKFISKLATEDLKEQARSALFVKDAEVLFKCDHCSNVFERRASSVIRALNKYENSLCLCPLCSHHVSIFENDVAEYINSIVGESCVERNVRHLLRGLEIDIYIPSKNIGIECNGSYWHSIENGKWPSYHQEKFQLAEARGIHLIQIYDVDWRDNNARIKATLHDMLSPEVSIIGARKLSLCEVPYTEAKSFYELNHLQGSTSACRINYGLYHEDSLMCCMGFGSSNFHSGSLDCDLELHRYAVKSGFVIVGGAERLLRAFERTYKPKSLLSYSANDWFTGAMYHKLGFEFLGFSQSPRYFWVNGLGDVFPREACQLKALSKMYPDVYTESINLMMPNKERYIMRAVGYYQCYRSGNKRWVKTYT